MNGIRIVSVEYRIHDLAFMQRQRRDLCILPHDLLVQGREHIRLSGVKGSRGLLLAAEVAVLQFLSSFVESGGLELAGRFLWALLVV